MSLVELPASAPLLPVVCGSPGTRPSSKREGLAFDEQPEDSPPTCTDPMKASKPFCHDGVGHTLRGLPAPLDFFLLLELGEDAVDLALTSVFLGALAATAMETEQNKTGY